MVAPGVRLPDDLLDFYRETDGGRGKIVSEQGEERAEIILYSRENMPEAQKKLSRISEKLYEEAYLLDERLINEEERNLLNRVYAELMVLGEVIEGPDTAYLLLYKNTFMLVDQDSLSFPFFAEGGWSYEEELCATQNSFTDFLNDVMIHLNPAYLDKYASASGQFGDGKSMRWYRLENTFYTVGDGVFCSTLKPYWDLPGNWLQEEIDRVVIGYGCARMELSALGIFHHLREIKIPETLTALVWLDNPEECESMGYCYFTLDDVDLSDELAPIANLECIICEKLHFGIVDGKMIEGTLVYSTREGVLFDAEMKTLRVCPHGKKGLYRIPDGVTAIEDGAFQDCTELTSVIIPDSVTPIEEQTFRGVRHIVYHGPAQSDDNWGALCRNEEEIAETE